MVEPRKSAPQPTRDASLDRVIAGRYRLEARIGEGGMGVVYRARHVLIDRVVAVKLIRPDLRTETHLRAWMLREARAANRVDHAHIIDIQDIGETDEGELYLVMEYLVGAALSAEIAKGPMPIRRSIDIIEQMVAALARAHDLGVVHRDLKSDNILLTTRGGRQDFVKILDFGLAALAHDPRLAPKGAVFGTPEYMSPEQARGEQAGPQSDLYAVGILLFELLTGRLPFRAPDRDTLLEMQRSAKPTRPSALRPNCHAVAEQIALRLLEKDPVKRFRDGHHLLEELKGLQRSLPAEDYHAAVTLTPSGLPPTDFTTEPPDVTEWATRAGLFARMAARAFPDEGSSPVRESLSELWTLAARATTLEGRMATDAGRLESAERRGHSLKAELGRMVEELAAEESRVLRTAMELSREEASAATAVERASEFAQKCQAAADAAVQQGQSTPEVFERLGGANARVHAKRQWRESYASQREDKETRGRELRRQIDELRGQLARFLEEAEHDLTARREHLASLAKEALGLERDYDRVTRDLTRHLEMRPECREVFAQLKGPNDTAGRLGLRRAFLGNAGDTGVGELRRVGR